MTASRRFVLRECSMPRLYSRLNGRRRFGSTTVVPPPDHPVHAVSSLACAYRSPLRSVHTQRLLESKKWGFTFSARPVASLPMYLLKLPFNTVFWLPVRSYATPSRGTTLFQSLTSVLGVRRSGTKTPAGEYWSGNQMNVSSNRAPALIVRRLAIIHRS